MLTHFASKCSKFVTGKKSAAGDKPAVKRHEKPISWARLPFATVPVLTTDDMKVQKTRVSHCLISPCPSSSEAPFLLQFLEIWNEDGLTAEPEDDFI